MQVPLEVREAIGCPLPSAGVQGGRELPNRVLGTELRVKKSCTCSNGLAGSAATQEQTLEIQRGSWAWWHTPFTP